MKFDRYKEVIMQLEDRCVTNPDNAFAEYLLTDLQETGGVIGLFTSTDEYYFWLEIAREVYDVIDALIGGNDPQAKELLLRAIKLKRVVDDRLSEYGKSEETILADLGLSEENPEDKKIAVNIAEPKKTELFKAVYQQLKEDRYTAISFEAFMSNFESDRQTQKINWTGTQKALMAFLKILHRKKIITDMRPLPHIAAEHFLFNGRFLKAHNMGVTKSQVNEDSPEYRRYFEIIEGILN